MSPRFRPPPLRIAVDRREQTPFPIIRERCAWAPYGVELHPATLREGDYTSAGSKHFARIERKSGPDFYSSVIHNWPRFERELVRLSRYPRSCIIVEAEFSTFLDGRYGRAHPHSLEQFVAAIYERHGVAVFFAPDAHVAARWCVGMLWRAEQEARKVRRPFAMHRRRVRARRADHRRALPVPVGAMVTEDGEVLG